VNWITYSDIIELREKMRSSRLGFFLNKLNINSYRRSAAHWNEKTIPPANWWNIPRVRERWNKKITGDPFTNYVDYLVNTYIAGSTYKRMLSIGCGTGTQELLFAKTNCFSSITAIDFAANNISSANAKNTFEELQFIHTSFEDFQPTAPYDVILFHSSLHHLKNMEFVMEKVKSLLHDGGLVIIHEYTGPNRISWNKTQIDTTNKLLNAIPATHRIYYASKKLKRKQTAPGWIRMVLSDPSEAVEAEKIIPLLQSHFTELELKGYGGNILTPLLKGISHHFIEKSPTNDKLLSNLFEAEDLFLQHHIDDYHFGVYQKK
jgi:2-polyprenyl-3-methyl-5-hydroxy-6-metoxy-1,4-benzoquinol methylase